MSRNRPQYLRVYEELRASIINGDYALGARLPSKRAISERQGVSVVTVEHALSLLADEGYTEPRERSGVFVAFRREDAFSAPERPVAPPPAVPAQESGVADTAFPFTVMARAMRRVLADYQARILVKPPNAGTPELRRALSAYLARSRGLRVSPEQIFIGAGSEYLYGMIVEALGRGRTYAIEKPSYEKIEQVYQARGVRCEQLPLGPEGIASSALARTGATVLHITPYRSFPSGVTATAAKRREYARWAGQGDRWVVEDDFESEFSLIGKPEETVFALCAGGRALYLNTFSRTVSPSLRVGYLVLPEGLVGRFHEAVGFYSCAVPAFEQYVLADLLDSGEFERHISRVRRRLRRSSKK